MKNVELIMNKKSQTEEQNLQFKAEEITEEQGTTIITNMFTAFGVQPVITMLTELHEAPAQVAAAIAASEPPPVPVKPQPAPVRPEAKMPERPRQLPMLGSDRGTFSIADTPMGAKLLEAASQIVDKTPRATEAIDEQPSYLKTGVKVVDEAGVPTQLFRVRCNCPKCQWRGNRYIKPDGRYYVKCLNCQQKLTVVPATDQHMVPDEYNNFFRADEEYYDAWQTGGNDGQADGQ